MKPYIFGARNGIYIIDLQKTVQLFRLAYNFLAETVAAGGEVARVHTGDPALYGAVAEQAALLAAAGIDYDIVPGVTSACAAAAAARVSFTAPGTVQSLVVTRLPGRTGVPEAQAVRRFAEA